MGQTLSTSTPASLTRHRQRGYSLVEALIVVAIGLILTTFAVVRVQSALRTYTVNSTAADIARTIGVVRYQGITNGRNACTLFTNNQFGNDPNCDTVFTAADLRVQIPAGVSLSQAVPPGVGTTGMPFSPLPAPLPPSCTNYNINFNTRGSTAAVCGTVVGAASVSIFFVTGWGNTSAVTVTGTGRARSWQYLGGSWR